MFLEMYTHTSLNDINAHLQYLYLNLVIVQEREPNIFGRGAHEKNCET